MALFDLILADQQRKIADNANDDLADLTVVEAYWKGVEDASKGAEEYLREIFPDK